MAQNKTFVPELSDSDNVLDNFYKNFGQRNTRGENGTVIMEGNSSPLKESINENDNTIVHFSRERAILGFFYSVSNNGKTEFWPLYQGRNVIGSDRKTCDVCLLERSVSPLHATLVIQQQRNPEKVVASLRDEGSEEGTLQNGVNVGFTNVECFNGDILTFGNSYELLLLLIDKKDLRLSPADNFESINIGSKERNVVGSEMISSLFEREEEDNDTGTVGFE